jgi:hypothetical protein
MSERSELMGLINTARYNPGSIQRVIIDQIERTHSGDLELVDPMNPFIFLIEAMATIAGAQFVQAEDLTRKQYPQTAQSFEDLYHHMADQDYIGRFDTPASVKMNLLLGKDEVIRMAVPIGQGNIRKITIPRHTSFKVADTIFTMQYPIDVRVMGNGGIQVVYDGSKDSPLYELETNKLNWTLENYTVEHAEMINIEIPVLQFFIDSYNVSLNGTTSFKKTFVLKDNFYHCRASMSDRQGNWSEIGTTHSDQVFDPMKPTLLLRVIDNLLVVSLPQVYYNTGLANNELRIDIYLTKGPTEIPLQTYSSNSFVAKFIDLEKDDNGIYTAPLLAMTTLAVFSTDTVSGGGRGLNFDQLRDRVMRNTLGSNDIPITPAQVASRLTDLGYASVLNIDNITNRVYLATRAMPLPKNGSVTSGAGATIAMLSTTMELLSEHNTIVNNGYRITVLPSTLYKNNNGVIEIVGDDEMDLIHSLPIDNKLSNINETEYLFSPLHYVVDISENTLVNRPYYLDDPIIKTKIFVDDNDTLGVGVNSSVHAFERTVSGWRLLVKTDTDASFKELPDKDVYLQLAFKPVGESDLAYLNGKLVGKDPETLERIYEFLIDSNWDINRNHEIGITSFSIYEPVNRTFMTSLTSNFDIIYSVANIPERGFIPGWVDTQLGNHLLPHDTKGLYYERLTLSFGESLHGLWNRARTVIGDNDVEVYAEDVLGFYSETQYARDVTGAIEMELVDGKRQFKVLHLKGDPILDIGGNHITLYYKGEVKYDENKNPIELNPRKVVRQLDMFLLDGAYFFTTGESDIAYAKSVPVTLVTWLKDHIRPLANKVLEKTTLYLHPRATVGYVSALIGAGKKTRLLAAQQLLVTFYVSSTVYKDFALRSSIEQSSTESIATLLTKPVVARDEIQTMIKTVVGADIISVELQGLGGSADLSTITLADDSGRLCIGKRLVSSPDGTLVVMDDIQFIFVQHSVF